MRALTAGEIKDYGRTAAVDYADRRTPLTAAVVQTLADTRLTDEQVRRVVEEANVHAYLAEFGQAGKGRNVVFDQGPADPQAVLAALAGEVNAPTPAAPEPPTAPTAPTPPASALTEDKQMGKQADKQTAAVASRPSMAADYYRLAKAAGDSRQAVLSAEQRYEQAATKLAGLVGTADDSHTELVTAIKLAAPTDWMYNLAVYELGRRIDFPTPGMEKTADQTKTIRMVKSARLAIAPGHPITAVLADMATAVADVVDADRLHKQAAADLQQLLTDLE